MKLKENEHKFYLTKILQIAIRIKNIRRTC